MQDYLPTTAADLKAWADNFVNVTSGAPAHFGITAGDVTAINTAAGLLGNAIVDKTNKETFFRASVASLNTAEADLRALVRPLVKHVQIASAVTNSDRAHLMITVPDTTHTPPVVGVEIPTLELKVIINTVLVHFGTDATHENKNHLVSWAHGCNIYRKLHAEADFTLVNFEPTSPYHDDVTWPAQEVEYKVAYRGRRSSQVGGTCPPERVVCGHT